MFIDDLVQDAGFVADDFSSEADIEIFEGDGEEVGAMERAKKINAGTIDTRKIDAERRGAVVADAA